MSDVDMPRVARTLSEIAHSLASGDDADGRIRRTLTLLTKIVPYDRCALLDTQAAREKLIVVPEQPRAEIRTLIARLRGYWRLMGEVEPAPTESTEQGSPESRAAGRSHLAIPVPGVNEIVGVLLVEHQGTAYDEHSLRLLSIVAAQLGAYLAALRMRQEELEHARQLGIAVHRLQETDRRKDDFLAMLGHELRNPLGAITFALRVMDRHDDVDSNAKYHRIIDRQINHLSRIVDELLDASRVRLGKIVLKRERVDLGSVARRWLEAFGNTSRVQALDVRIDAAEEPIEVDGDTVRLEQVFSNLMTNALKFTPPGGQVRVSIRAEDGQGVVRVRDTGIGMTPEVLASAFDLFVQAEESPARQEGGIGLGLSLVRTLVEKHQGTVEAFSEGPGRGSELVVRIPLAAAFRPAVEEEKDLPWMEERTTPLRALVVEDNEDARELLEALLERWGLQVFSASDGLQAVIKAVAERPDVALIDIGLPGLNGFDVARRIREDLPSTPVTLIAMTGYGRPDDRRRAMDVGFDHYMVKPIDHNALRERLASIRPAAQTRP